MHLNAKFTGWSGKRIWIVGASSGIGEALARHFDQLGACLVLSARNGDKLETLCKQLKNASALPLDVSQAETVNRAFLKIKENWTDIDLVVTLAGTYSEMSVQHFNLGTIEQQIDVNLNGTLRVLDAVLPTFIEQKKGHIAIVSSVAGYRGLPNSLGYGPSKAALINLAEALYLELKSFHVGVSLINPGFVDTPLTQPNTFPMPFLITPEKAAQEIVLGLEKGEFEIHFPKALTRSLRILRVLPYTIYFWLAGFTKRHTKTQKIASNHRSHNE